MSRGSNSATPPFLYIRGKMAEAGMVDRYKRFTASIEVACRDRANRLHQALCRLPLPLVSPTPIVRFA
jgi:hypothetical protein